MGATPVRAELLAAGEIAPGRQALTLRLPELIASLRAGHALHLLHAEAGGYRLRRVAPVTNIDLLTGSVQVALQPRADGGRDSLAELAPGAHLSVVGPIGKPIEVDPDALKVLIIADAEGFPWIRLLAESLTASGRSVTLLLESRTAAEIPSASLLPESVEIHVATEDGTLGHQGSAAELVGKFSDWTDQAFAAGSRVLLGATTLMLRAARVDDRVSRRASRAGDGVAAKRLQLIMAHEIGCGSGVCGGCTYQSAAGTVRLCKEGPAVAPAGVERARSNG